MKVRFLDKESKPNDSPTLYATVEVPARLMMHLGNDGTSGEILRPTPPIIHVKADGNYILRRQRMTDAEALSQMSIPHHEACIEVPKSSILPLLAGV